LSPAPAAEPEELGAKESLERLRSIKHIVVLMMENRSFDQMLGFLSKHDRVKGVRGLTGGEVNYDEQGTPYESFEWEENQTSFHPPQDRSGKILDPCHGPDCVKQQLAPHRGVTPGGFVTNFLGRKDKKGKPIEIPDEYRGLPMGYYSERHLPVYDLLAREYGVCDAWHCSIPGDTWPNRLYGMAGEEGKPMAYKPGPRQKFFKWLAGLPYVGQIANAPIFEVDAFTHQLGLEQWRWYSHDPSTLRAADKAYRDFRHLNRDNFTFFDRKRMSLLTQAAEGLMVDLHDSFLDDAAKGELRDVSWIDPNFVDLKVLDPNSNDDHPPSDVQAGQALVLETYEALVKSKEWEDTLLIVVYDEHGGFYDHVSPKQLDPDDPARPKHETLGVRVPALVIGPRVKKGVCHELFEHTTLISTILHCFAEDGDAALAKMPPRARHAPHLGSILEREARTDLDRGRLREGIADARRQLDEARREARRRRRAREGAPSEDTDGGAGQKQELLDWQEEFIGFALSMRDAGLPPGQP
jgi:phospholipase C